MMLNENYFEYFENDLFQIIRLPYKGELNSLYVILPVKNISLDDVITNINANNFNDILLKLVRFNGQIGLPKFKYKYIIELKEIIKNYGLVNLFHNDGYLNNINENAFISNIKSGAFIEVNEYGTKAAGFVFDFGAEGAPFEMIVNKPFFYILRDDISETILFIGVVLNPNE